MTLTLTPEQEAVVEHSVHSGRFSSAGDALSAALSLLQDQESALRRSEEARLLHEKYPTLVDLFEHSPFKGLDIEFPRDRSPLRDVEF
ncbi:MAG: type II toxin-antitoxin system ParD family antitoxin [Acidobacteriota bacterium]